MSLTLICSSALTWPPLSTTKTWIISCSFCLELTAGFFLCHLLPMRWQAWCGIRSSCWPRLKYKKHEKMLCFFAMFFVNNIFISNCETPTAISAFAGLPKPLTEITDGVLGQGVGQLWWQLCRNSNTVVLSWSSTDSEGSAQLAVGSVIAMVLFFYFHCLAASVSANPKWSYWHIWWWRI